MTEWMRYAKCRGTSPEFFLPQRGSALDEDRKEFCRTCPAKKACLNYAIENRLPGIWGGTTGRERQRLRAS